MSEHLTLERLSAVLDEPGADGAAVAHMDECAACQREYEAMSRMRMALSGLTELEAPDVVWAGIEAALPGLTAGSSDTSEPPVIELRERRSGFGLLGSWPIKVAATLLVFVGGLMVGDRLRRENADAPTVAAGPLDSAVQPAADAARVTYENALASLDELRLRTVSTSVNPAEDPAAAAQRLIHLDALVAASREALRRAPEDPAVNDFLFQVIDERDALNAELSDVLHAATAEYR